jgi:hypothetical protein
MPVLCFVRLLNTLLLAYKPKGSSCLRQDEPFYSQIAVVVKLVVEVDALILLSINA